MIANTKGTVKQIAAIVVSCWFCLTAQAEPEQNPKAAPNVALHKDYATVPVTLSPVDYKSGAAPQPTAVVPAYTSAASQAFKNPIDISAYFDGHYVFDANRPVDGARRTYSSGPVKTNGFAIGYSYLQAIYENDAIKATVATHYGDVVDVMYRHEESTLKAFREASLRYKVNSKLSFEGGIMPSFFGLEIFINKKNYFASRAIMTDFAPDFTQGVRANYKFTDQWYGTLEVGNGWQVLTDTNHNKAISALLVYDQPDKLMFHWAFMRTNEQPKGSPSLPRYYNNFFTKLYFGKLTVVPLLDVGLEKSEHGRSNYDYWVSSGLITRYQFAPQYAAAIRYENIYDPHEIVDDFITHTPHGFQAQDVTVSVEHTPSKDMTLRLEARQYYARDPIFTAHDNTLSRKNFFVMASVAFSLG